MAKLILSLDRSVLKEVALDRELITIGRKPQNDVQIDNLAVSAEHARILTILGDSFLEDLGSTNGTRVNGKPITRHNLQPNDVIEIGKYKLKYVVEGTAVSQRSTPEAERTMEVPAARADARQPPMPAASESGVAAEAVLSPDDVLPEAAIQVLNGKNAGKSMPLIKDITTLGKPGVQVVVIARSRQGYSLRHAEGSTYPSVNGKPVGPQAHPLQDHDVIELGGLKMEFFFKSS